MSYKIKQFEVCGELRFEGQITEDEYDQFVTELELKARELWPEHFTPRTLNDWHKEFVNVEREDGETDTLTAEEARRLDLRFRQQQIPQNSKGTK